MPASRATQVYRAQGLSYRRSGLAARALLLVGLLAVPSAGAWAAQPQTQPNRVAGSSAAAREDALGHARLLYNERHFEQAIAAAEQVARQPGYADRARLVIGRAQLERYRQSSNQADLAAARATFSALNASGLTAKERFEYQIGLGEALYLDNAFGAAAEMFAAGLGADASADARDSALDWWATSLDRLAQVSAEDNRQDIYSTIVARMDAELEKNSASTAATYWLAAAARGAGDPERAWHAAIAGWVRALLLADRGTRLRVDLNYLVETAIIPERARQVAASDRDRLMQAMKTEWEGVKAAWK